MKTGDFTLTTEDGVEVYVRRLDPDAPPRGTVVLVHGVAEHGGRYVDLAARLAAEGWAVFIPDHRGHGRTAASSGGRGWFAAKDGFFRVVEDLDLLRGRVEAELGGKPLAMVAHSMGSSLARAYICLHGDGLDGCALSGPLALPPALAAASHLIVALGRLVQGGRGIAKFADDLTLGGYNKGFAPARTRFDWLSRDPAVVDAYAADPDCGFTCTWDWFRDMQEGMDFYLKSSSLARIPKALPIYVFAGSKDPVGGALGVVDAMAAAYRAAGLGRVETRVYPGARHETLNETNRDEVRADLVAWLDRIAPRK